MALSAADIELQEFLAALDASLEWGREWLAPHVQRDAKRVDPKAGRIVQLLTDRGLNHPHPSRLRVAPGEVATPEWTGIILPTSDQGTVAVPVICVAWSNDSAKQRSIRVYLFENPADGHLRATGFHLDAPNPAESGFGFPHAQLCERHVPFIDGLGEHPKVHNILPRIPIPEWATNPTSLLRVALQSIYGTGRIRDWQGRLTGKVPSQPDQFWIKG
jgi:hypothetical protein